MNSLPVSPVSLSLPLCLWLCCFQSFLCCEIVALRLVVVVLVVVVVVACGMWHDRTAVAAAFNELANAAQ